MLSNVIFKYEKITLIKFVLSLNYLIIYYEILFLRREDYNYLENIKRQIYNKNLLNEI